MEYPFIKCLLPKYIQNKYTGEVILSSCGKCAACINASASQRVNLIKLQAEESSYCFMVTLTFDNKHVPKVEPFFDNNDTYFRYKGYTRNIYINHDNLVLDSDRLSIFSDNLYRDKYNLDLLVSKSNLNNGCIAVLDKWFLQSFLKRFRYYCKKYGIYEKVHHFCCGEYGPVHFRPHFHCLFFFDSQRLLSFFKQVLYKAWRYGFISFCSVSGDRAFRYVAKYVNSSVSLPPLFETKAFKPFTIHSNFFAASYYQKKGKEIYQSDLRTIIQRICKIGNSEQCISVWRNITNCLFPKVRGFNRSDDNQLFKLYTIYDVCVKFFGEGFEVTDYVEYICNSSFRYFDCIKYEYQIKDNLYRRLKRSFESIAHDLYISKMFLNLITQNGTIYSKSYNSTVVGDYVCDYIRVFKEFYSLLELQRLKNFYQSQIDNPHLDYRFFYDNFSASHMIQENPYFHTFHFQQNLIAVNSVKHKKLNDLNFIFSKHL